MPIFNFSWKNQNIQELWAHLGLAVLSRQPSSAGARVPWFAPVLPSPTASLIVKLSISFLLPSHLHCCLRRKRKNISFPDVSIIRRKTKARLRRSVSFKKSEGENIFLSESEEYSFIFNSKQGMSVWEGYSSR